MVREADLAEVRQQINEIRNFDIRGEFEKTVDADGSLRATASSNPLVTPAPVPTAGLTVVPAAEPGSEAAVAEVAAEAPNAEARRRKSPPAAPDVRAAEAAGAPAFIPPAIATAPEPPAFIPPRTAQPALTQP